MTRYLPLILLCACGSAVGPASLQAATVNDACELDVNPDSTVEGDTLHAERRLTAATGCTFTRTDAGIPVHLAIIGESDGNVACGISYFAHPDGTIIERGDVFISSTFWRDCDYPVDSIVAHELMHELINRPGAAYDGSHAPSGVFQLYEAPGADVLNDETLSYFCARAQCQTFNPEQ